ncbi:HSPB1-associated protein 1 homolog [Rhincodon typus]|uniref:HSPB1-associated protein 1 homolog n=1 Tax=Rhincodon typus TaxID=259920 RepID=UPI00202FFE41|nr:HSPB1-associated protein 1 homolog [Rhincodon typus]
MVTGCQSVAKEGLHIRAVELEGKPLIMSQDSKPFNPEEVRVIMASLQQPAVFLNMVSDWPALKWNVEHLSHLLNGKPFKFRIGERKMTKDKPCVIIALSVAKSFLGVEEVTLGVLRKEIKANKLKLDLPVSPGKGKLHADSRPRLESNLCPWRCEAAMLTTEPPHCPPKKLCQDVIWSDFGYPGRDARDSTLWIGTEAANTPCHLDSYGCNLVLQVQGRKRWHLFPPEDTASLYPTRIPYEESSVFSSVNVVNPDFARFPRFHGARPHVVTLHPGEQFYFEIGIAHY